MSNVLSENWIFTTIQISDGQDMLGTGFLVAQTGTATGQFGHTCSLWTPAKERTYLVTCAHVLGEEIAPEYTLIYNSLRGTGYRAQCAIFEIRNDPPNWAIHPDPKVDIAVLDVTSWLGGLPDAVVRFCPLTELASPISLLDTDCDTGDDAFVLGYPLGFRQGSTGIPLIRKGILASSPRRRLSRRGSLVSGFLIDGAIIPGSSGSPVVSSSTRFISGDMATTVGRPVLLGVVVSSYVRLDEDRDDFTDYANLGFAHGASTVIETIMEFGHYSVQDFLGLDHLQHWAPQLGLPAWALEFDGLEVDSLTAFRIRLRKKRDRMRALGFDVPPSDFHDAPELLGQITSRADQRSR